MTHYEVINNLKTAQDLIEAAFWYTNETLTADTALIHASRYLEAAINELASN